MHEPGVWRNKQVKFLEQKIYREPLGLRFEALEFRVGIGHFDIGG